jgi:beta-glucuronidase
MKRGAQRGTMWMCGWLTAGMTVGSAAGTTAMINVDHRDLFDLGGAWKVIPDPYEAGFYNYRWQEDRNGYFRDRRAERPTDLVEYSFDNADALQVPGDWNTQRPEFMLYEGTLWYRKTFALEPDANRRYFVYFGAVNYEAIVYLNGEKLGLHEGGFTPFAFEVTNHVRPGSNALVVKVDNKRRRDAIPTLNTDWWNYGGITRRVLLVATPETYVKDYVVQLAPGRSDRIEGWVQLDGPDAAGTVTVSIPEAGLQTEAAVDTAGRAAIAMDAAGLQRWAPGQPKLYDVEIMHGSDTLHDTIGFRTVETRGHEILVNGESIYLRGICIHEEAPLRGGRAHGPDDSNTLLDWVQELDCNFVRLAHYPHNEFMVREADRRGILLWSEVPVYWTIQWENDATATLARQQIEEMITRDRNRACVILWSLANETPVGDSRNTFLKGLADHARTLDPTRLLTAAMEKRYVNNGTTIHIDDPFGEHLDVLGCNEYVGWYDGLPPKADGLTWSSAYDKPVIISEFGGGAKAGLHGDPVNDRWTEEFQAAIYHHQVAMLDKVPFVRGMTPWILADFRSPRRPLPGIQDGWNRKGLISNHGERKLAFDVLQAYYRTKAEQTE